MIDVEKIRQDFPMIVNHPELIYFDNGATTYKPKAVSVISIVTLLQMLNVVIMKQLFKLIVHMTIRVRLLLDLSTASLAK